MIVVHGFIIVAIERSGPDVSSIIGYAACGLKSIPSVRIKI